MEIPANVFEERGIAKNLKIVLVTVLLASITISILTAILKWRLTPQLCLLASASCLVALLLIRSGRIRTALLAPFLTITYVVLHLATRSDGLQNIGLAILPVLLVVGSLVLNRVMLAFFTAAVVLGVAGMALIRYFVMYAEPYSTNDLGDFVIFAATCATAALAGRQFALRIEEAFRLVRKRESRYRRIFENVQDVYFEMGLDGILLDVSPACSALFGVPRESVIDVSLARFCAGQPEFAHLLEAVRTRGRVSNLELALCNAREVLVNASLQADVETGIETIVGAIRDVTDRKHAELALRDSEERFRTLCAAAFEGIMVHSDGAILDANPQFAQLFGYDSAEELIGRDGVELMMRSQSATAPGQGTQKVSLGPCEITGVRKDGSTFAAETDSRPIQYGGCGAIIVSCRDISERKRAESEREKLWAQLAQAQKMDSIGRLAGGVAHDFNNLLTVINGYSQMLLNKLPSGDRNREFSAQILHAGKQAADLTGQLLAFSRKQILEPQVLDLNRVAGEMRPMIQSLVGEDIEVRLVLSLESPVVRADPHQLKQVILNMSVNSRDAMPEGGLLLIETSVGELDSTFRELHPGTRSGKYVILAVSDTGTGMDEATRQRIFEPFFTTKPVGKGTGLGLSMVEGIVAQSGGYVDVLSEPGRGTTFKTYLPALEGVKSDEEILKRAAAVQGNETVLVVEDRPEVRKYGVAVLQQYGYKVIAAAGASEALSICEREPARIDLLLTDVVMPNTSGRELAARIVQKRPGIKTLFMSGHSDAGVAYGKVDEVAHFLQKPFTPEELGRKVRLVLGQMSV